MAHEQYDSHVHAWHRHQTTRAMQDELIERNDQLIKANHELFDAGVFAGQQALEIDRLGRVNAAMLAALRNITECAEAGTDGANMDLWIEQAQGAQLMTPYHLTVVELPSKYPGTLFGIHDSRTNSLQSNDIGGKISVVQYDIREHAQSEIGRQRREAAISAMLSALKDALASPCNAAIPTTDISRAMRAAIAQAEAADIKAEG